MHCSGMRAVRNSSRLLRRGVPALGVSASRVPSLGACLRGACSRGPTQGGGCLLQGVSGHRGVPAEGVCLLRRVPAVGAGVGACLGGVVSQHALRQTSPRGQIDRCKNITFATSLRTVKMYFNLICPKRSNNI